MFATAEACSAPALACLAGVLPRRERVDKPQYIMSAHYYAVFWIDH